MLIIIWQLSHAGLSNKLGDEVIFGGSESRNTLTKKEHQSALRTSQQEEAEALLNSSFHAVVSKLPLFSLLNTSPG